MDRCAGCHDTDENSIKKIFKFTIFSNTDIQAQYLTAWATND